MTLGSWTDLTPLTSGAYLSLRTDTSNVQFDDVAVSVIITVLPQTSAAPFVFCLPLR